MQQVPQKRYNTYSAYIKKYFGQRVQKITLDTGFSCPNRDGSKGVGGCTYCNNNTFNPGYCKPIKSINQQLSEGIAMFSKKYKTQQYLAYFQAYTNTYADIELVKKLYLEALSHPNIKGLVIGTRPDCVSIELADFLEELAKTTYVSVEFGVETTLNRTLLQVNRCHTFEETIAAYKMMSHRGIHLGAHIIIGLPGESKQEMMQHATKLSALPIDSLKIHHLQIVKHTMMAVQYRKNPENFNLFSVEDYLDFITEFIAAVRPDLVLERFISESPKDLLIAPNWGGIKNYAMLDKIDKLLIEKEYYQGLHYSNKQ
ncbi:MAG: TIGR01212 family radical SAM protein [Flavobacteriaceae bacterium]|nr:TIGR01212 family radical SAM protein [Flavobacteriaceae bacterium]